MSQSPQVFIVRSYAAALWLISRGYEPLQAERVRDGSGSTVFHFAPTAADALSDFHKAKDRLNAMSLLAQPR